MGEYIQREPVMGHVGNHGGIVIADPMKPCQLWRRS